MASLTARAFAAAGERIVAAGVDQQQLERGGGGRHLVVDAVHGDERLLGIVEIGIVGADEAFSAQVDPVAAEGDQHQIAWFDGLQHDVQLPLDVAARGAIAVFVGLVVQQENLISGKARRHELIAKRLHVAAGELELGQIGVIVHADEQGPALAGLEDRFRLAGRLLAERRRDERKTPARAARRPTSCGRGRSWHLFLRSRHCVPPSQCGQTVCLGGRPSRL